MGGEKVASTRQFVERLEEPAAGERAPVPLQVERGAETRFVGLPLPMA